MYPFLSKVRQRGLREWLSQGPFRVYGKAPGLWVSGTCSFYSLKQGLQAPTSSEDVNQQCESQSHQQRAVRTRTNRREHAQSKFLIQNKTVIITTTAQHQASLHTVSWSLVLAGMGPGPPHLVTHWFIHHYVSTLILNLSIIFSSNN